MLSSLLHGEESLKCLSATCTKREPYFRDCIQECSPERSFHCGTFFFFLKFWQINGKGQCHFKEHDIKKTVTAEEKRW